MSYTCRFCRHVSAICCTPSLDYHLFPQNLKRSRHSEHITKFYDYPLVKVKGRLPILDTHRSARSIHPAVGWHYFPPGLRLPSQPQSITASWPVPSYTAWWQRHISVNHLPKVVTQLLPPPPNRIWTTTCWSQVQRSTVAPKILLILLTVA